MSDKKETFTNIQTIAAIETFLEFGEKGFDKLNLTLKDGVYTFDAPPGYYSGLGWASRCLKAHLEDLKKHDED